MAVRNRDPDAHGAAVCVSKIPDINDVTFGLTTSGESQSPPPATAVLVPCDAGPATECLLNLVNSR